MGALTLITELMSLILAALVLIVGVTLLGLWALISTMFISKRWRVWAVVVCAGEVIIGGVFGFVTWIILIVDREEIKSVLMRSGMTLSRDNIIAAGFACWIVVFITQVKPRALPSLTFNNTFPPSNLQSTFCSKHPYCIDN